MKTRLLLGCFLFLLVFSAGYFFLQRKSEMSGAPPYGEPEEEVPIDTDPYAWLHDWTRPEGPPRVGLQVGHWKNEEFPEELAKLRNNGGASGGGKSEWEVNLAIAEETAAILQAEGVEVDILPATVPPRYWADAFVAIHADGSTDRSVSGFKVAPPWRDWTGQAETLNDAIEASYSAATQLRLDPNVSRNMRGYYAFSFWRFEHAVHPMTTSVILETGFLTSPADRRTIVDRPEISAQGLADGILAFLRTQGVLKSS